MANRNSTAAFQAEIIKEQNQPIHLVEIHFDEPSGVQYLTDAFIPVTYSSNTYQPLGYLLSFSNIEETTDIQVGNLTLNLSGIDQVYIKYVLEERFVDRKVVIRKAFLNTSDDSLIANPIIIYQGNMNTPSITESGDMSVVSVEVANQFVDFSKTPGRFTNAESQHLFYPDDKGFEYAPEIIKDIVWGREYDAGIRNGGGVTTGGTDTGVGTVITDTDIGVGSEISILLTGMAFTIYPNGNVVVNKMGNTFQVGYLVHVTGAIGEYRHFINGYHIVTASTADSFTYATTASPGSILYYEGGAEVTINDEPVEPGIDTTVDTNVVVIPVYEPEEVFVLDEYVVLTEVEDVGGIDETYINDTPVQIVEVAEDTISVAVTVDVETTSPPIQTDTAVNNVVTVNEIDHSYITGDTVIIAGSIGVGGVPASEINTTHTVGAITPDTFQVAVTTDPTSTVTHGGGPSVTIDAEIPKPPPLATTEGSPTITNYQSDHGLIVGDKFRLSGTSQVGGLPLNLINTQHTVTAVPDANSFTFTAGQNATATEQGGGVLGTLTKPVKATSTAKGGGNSIKMKHNFESTLIKSSTIT
tara:strand:+ start:230 stop:1981 length:1752 start_codon:yes stop_codon:yes gene_type:complete